MEIPMTDAIAQYDIETSWSTRITDDIVLEAIQGHVPAEMESNILEGIRNINSGKVTDKVIYIKFFSIILREKVGRPIQAIATQLGHIAGIRDSAEAFEWGIILVKSCKDAGLYELQKVEDEWYVQPNFTLDKKTKHKIDRLQYLPPMQVVPLKWSTNKNGGWLWESKHLILGSKFTKHDRPQAYDVINKLQSIPWKIDADTYLFEKETNRDLNKKKFLRVVNEYLGKSFYFVWRYDSRGRSYCSGYDLSLQSNEYGKALISLKNKEKITNVPNLYVAIANHAGKDKLTWKERIDWVADQVVEEIEWKEPILGRKALRALEDAINNKPSGYVMSLDATSSGLQIMAAISGCKKTAAMVNCINPDIRRDVYTEVANLMNQSLAKPVLRGISKQSLMTHFYNSKATPKALLSDKQLKAFYDVIEGLLPGADEVMETINNCWDSEAEAHTWTMPDGHVVYVPVVEATNAVYSDEELGDVPLRYYRQTSSDNYRSLCPNVIHSIDGYIAREMIRRCDFQLSHIHDCFVFSPDHLQEVSQMYRVIMAEIAKGDILQDILRQITGDNALIITKASNDLDQDILKSSYMLS
tara:strand:- start:4991 stop:6742 length:1752 start_codon:yes stop_codon:yes gene_type:complete